MLIKPDRQSRYAELRRLIEEWSNEDPAFDQEVGALAEEALRESAPRHFEEREDWERLKASVEENRLSYRKRFEDEPCQTNPASE